jgi:hypothetical protein
MRNSCIRSVCRVRAFSNVYPGIDSIPSLKYNVGNGWPNFRLMNTDEIGSRRTSGCTGEPSFASLFAHDYNMYRSDVSSDTNFRTLSFCNKYPFSRMLKSNTTSSGSEKQEKKGEDLHEVTILKRKFKSLHKGATYCSWLDQCGQEAPEQRPRIETG